MRFRSIAIALVAVAISAGSALAQAVLKREPPSGALSRGKIVLVDDGSCPAGQIKEVTAGSGQGAGSTRRTRRCIPKN